MVPFTSHAILIGAGVLFLAAAAAHDVAARTIPHWTVIGTALVGLILQVQCGSLAASLGVAALLFTAAALCCQLGWMGGGDVKLLGAVALLLPPASILPALYAIALSGTALALPYLVLRGRLRPASSQRPRRLLARILRAERFRLRRGGPLPYGVAIAFGAVLNLGSAGA